MAEKNDRQVTVLYLAHGSVVLYYQVIFSVLTLAYHLKGDWRNLHLVIYTDKADLFEKFLKVIPFTIELLSASQLEAYQGHIHYLHRIKTVVFKNCFEKYKRDIFYLDGDTFFRKNPLPLIDKISGEVSIMNADEYDMIDAGNEENRDWLLIRRVIRNNYYTLHGKKFLIPFSTRMWNSGVLGLSRHQAALIDDTLDLIDQMYARVPVNHIEQFALAYILQHNTRLITSEDYVDHYWHVSIKGKLNRKLESFFKDNQRDSIHDLVQKAYELSLKREEIQKEVIVPGFLDRVLLRWKLVKKVLLKGHL